MSKYAGPTLISADGNVVLRYDPAAWRLSVYMGGKYVDAGLDAKYGGRVSIEQVRRAIEGVGLHADLFDPREWSEWLARVRASLAVPDPQPVDKSADGGP